MLSAVYRRTLPRVIQKLTSSVQICNKASPRMIAEILPSRPKVTIGNYLAKRLVTLGVNHYFTVPGDFTLALLDEMLKEESLTMIGCCNELNAGYAADGYARATKGLGVVCVTYMVGGLSTINAVAGAYSDDLPLLCVSGGPNIHDSQERHLIHHTIGEYELYQQSKCFEPIVAKTFVIKHPCDAAKMIDEALRTALIKKKPVYLEIPVNLSTVMIEAPEPMTDPRAAAQTFSDPATLEACLTDLTNGINASVKPVLLAGSKLRRTETEGAFLQLSETMGCATAIMPDAKGLVPEDHPNFIGRYWGTVSSPYVAEVVESADLVILAGPVLNDYTTVGWSALLPENKSLILAPDYVKFGGHYYPNVLLSDVLQGLNGRVHAKPASLQAFKRYHSSHVATTERTETAAAATSDRLTLKDLHQTVQRSLTPNTTILVETGDSWFIGQKLALPAGCKFHVQMQYGSIGWSVGALLGIGLAEGAERRVLAFIGDGSFQLTAQEISTMIRYQVKATIVLLNNNGYTIEVQIHDGPYNDIQMWDYASLPRVFNRGEEGRYALGLKATTTQEFADALAQSEQHDGLCLIEAVVDRDDCTEELLEWGSRVAKANSRLNL